MLREQTREHKRKRNVLFLIGDVSTLGLFHAHIIL